MTAPVDIRADHLAILHGILERNLPPGAQTWVFGSRARWTTHAGSDLDLAIDAGRPLSRPEVSRLRDDLAESDLPYEVDVVDLHHVPESFRKVIERDRVPLPEPGARVMPGA